MGAAAVVLWTFPQAIIAAYVDIADPANRATVEIARQLIVIAALFQVFDGMQVVAAGALRGYKDAVVPLLLAGFGYWGAGFAGGWVLAFPLGYGAVGLWWGLALGLAVVAVLLTAAAASDRSAPQPGNRGDGRAMTQSGHARPIVSRQSFLSNSRCR